MVTMHDVMDAQWWLDNMRDGKNFPFCFIRLLCIISHLLRKVHASCCEAVGSSSHITQEDHH